MAKLQAPPGKFRVVGVDTFDNEDYVIEDCADRTAALQLAKERGGVMHKTHVYDDMGRHIGEGGSF